MFFKTTNLLENMQKNFGGPILNKNTSQKNSWGGRAFPPQRVNLGFKRDWHKMGNKITTEKKKIPGIYDIWWNTKPLFWWSKYDYFYMTYIHT